MKAVLWVIVLGSLCLLSTAVHFTIQPKFDPSKFAGKWYDIAITFKHGDSTLRNDKGHYITIEPARNGIRYYEQVPELNCNKEEYFLEKTARPGVYKMSESTIYMLKTDYKNYIFIYVENQGERILHLYGRKRRVTKVVKDEFRKLVVSLDLPLYNIIYFKKAAQCTK